MEEEVPRRHTGTKRKADMILQPFSCSLEDLYTGCTKRMKFTRHVDVMGSDSTQERTLDISVKPGWSAGTKVTFHKEGDSVPGVEQADICFILQEETHPFFQREESNLIYTAEISLAQCFGGVKLTIPCLDGQERMACIRDIIHPNFEHRVPGAGMPGKAGGSYGDLIVRFDIKFPVQMKTEDRNQLKQIINANM